MLAIVITALATSGCPGRLDHPERFGVSTPDRDGGSTPTDARSDSIDVPAMLAMRCAGAGCHGAASPALGLDLVSDGLDARLIDATSAACMGRPLVDPASPDDSVLLEKVSEATPSCGTRMPLVGTPLSTEEIAALRAWIASL